MKLEELTEEQFEQFGASALVEYRGARIIIQYKAFAGRYMYECPEPELRGFCDGSLDELKNILTGAVDGYLLKKNHSSIGYGYHNGGRKSLPEGQKKVFANTTISGTPEEIAELKRMAKAQGKTVSRLVLDNLLRNT